ncbi:MAG: anthranilate/aminodeoxychorismate synthase component II [Candidatus Omnitrophica bacterium CG1_02_49_10]|nr:MAG: anthranilate/aminodeoxychorismate synthase component II [Candidatus Omnitrophica bacterium CG1_02_49_10]
MILMIDNYDSFTYNLVQYLGELGGKLAVYRNDEITIKDIERMKPEKIVISPGPGRPEDGGISSAAIKHFGGRVPILGVCLGHQCIAHVFGGDIVGARRLMHGKTSLMHHNGKDIFKGLSNPFEATRYHSLIVKRSTFPECLEVTAQTDKKEIMGLKHKVFQIYGVQFHPESILTKSGKKLLSNFIKMRRRG